MYDQYYGFTGRPFQLTPDPAFYFESGTHRKAMSYLGYGLAQGEGFIVITGDIGAGKTTLVGHLMATVDPRRLTAVQIVSTSVGGDDILRLAAHGFGIAADGADKACLLGAVEAFLHAEARAGRRCLLIVDEAQNLYTDALEELRMLSNFQLGGQPLLQIFLLGQPEFRDMISGEARLEQLRQRVIATHHLSPMQPDEVAPYIEHRLGIVGWMGTPRFTPEAYRLLAEATDGVPRRLNALVSRVLLLGAIDQLDVIDHGVIAAVIADNHMGDAVAPPSAAVPALAEAGQEAATPTFGPAVVSAAEPAEQDMIAEPRLEQLSGIRAEVQALSDALSDQPAISATGDLAARLDAIEARLAASERTAGEQEDVLRRILTKLIEWSERDDRTGSFAHRAA